MSYDGRQIRLSDEQRKHIYKRYLYLKNNLHMKRKHIVVRLGITLSYLDYIISWNKKQGAKDD